MKIFSVGQVNNYIKNIITQDYVLKSISIRGEVSNCKYHSLGHIYFSLKDETGSLPAVMFKGNASSGLDFTLRDGQSVVVSGSIGVYERDGRVQLYAVKIKQDGIGRLYEEFERLKQKLNEEGLFDCDIKKPIPKYPKKVGIVTARTGAAIQDIMNIARRRNPYVQLILYPAKVQGEGAANTIARGIEVLDKMGLDTIIVGRGGGSIEDLWAFNEEIVVRAIYAARTPIISGTGHEIDITLADYAADKRAPTPSAACELAVPDIMTDLKKLSDMENALRVRMDNKLSLLKVKLAHYDTRLNLASPVNRLTARMQYLADLYDRLRLAMLRKQESRVHRLELLIAKLDGLSPTARLVNGFGYIENSGVPMTSVRNVKPGDSIRITVMDGTVDAAVTHAVISDNQSAAGGDIHEYG